MNAAMYKALSGALVQTRRLELVTQDLANVNTAGYKGERIVFREVLEAPPNPDERIGGQVVVTEQRTDFSNGSLRSTGNPLDLALTGAGFFAVQTAAGVRYTRQGVFSLSVNNTIVNSAGEAVLGESGPIRVEGDRVDITAEGAVLVDGEEVDRLKIVQAEDPRRLVREGQTFFRAEEAEVQPATAVQVVQGSLEESNVSPIESMVALIALQRQFEAYERALRTMDSVTEKVVNQAGRL